MVPLFLPHDLPAFCFGILAGLFTYPTRTIFYSIPAYLVVNVLNLYLLRDALPHPRPIFFPFPHSHSFCWVLLRFLVLDFSHFFPSSLRFVHSFRTTVVIRGAFLLMTVVATAHPHTNACLFHYLVGWVLTTYRLLLLRFMFVCGRNVCPSRTA